MKTLEEYLIEEGILDLFLENFNRTTGDEVTLRLAFSWGRTRQGFSFWEEHYIRTLEIPAPLICMQRVINLRLSLVPRFRKEIV